MLNINFLSLTLIFGLLVYGVTNYPLRPATGWSIRHQDTD